VENIADALSQLLDPPPRSALLIEAISALSNSPLDLRALEASFAMAR
jgi:hypothetical protein